jgi:hypothetical protein
MLRGSNFAFNTAIWTVSSHTVLSFWIQCDFVIGAVSAFFVTGLHLFYFVFVVNWLWLRLQVILSLSVYFIVQLSKVVFVQNFPSYVGNGVLLTVRCVCVCVCVYVSHTHTYIVHDLQMEIRTMRKNSDSNCFSSIVSWRLLQIPGHVQWHRTPTSYCKDLSEREFILPVPNLKREKP